MGFVKIARSPCTETIFVQLVFHMRSSPIYYYICFWRIFIRTRYYSLPGLFSTLRVRYVIPVATETALVQIRVLLRQSREN